MRKELLLNHNYHPIIFKYPYFVLFSIVIVFMMASLCDCSKYLTYDASYGKNNQLYIAVQDKDLKYLNLSLIKINNKKYYFKIENITNQKNNCFNKKDFRIVTIKLQEKYKGKTKNIKVRVLKEKKTLLQYILKNFESR